MPASNEGELGSAESEAAQAPRGARSIAQLSAGVAGGPEYGADHGVIDEAVEYCPQIAGVLSAPPAAW